MDKMNYAEKFISFEQKHALFKKQIHGVYFWKLVRSRVYSNILEESGVLDKKSYTVEEGLQGRIRAFLKYCAVAFINALEPIKRTETLIVTHPRKVLVNNSYEDIYTSWLVNLLQKNERDFLLLDVPLNWSTHPMKMQKNMRKIENFSFVRKVFYKYISKDVSLAGESLQAIAKDLKKVFGCDGNIIQETCSQIKFFKIDYHYYLKLLKKIKPNKIWLVIGYAHHGLIAAAKNLGILVEEIQHGMITPHHMNYSFGGERDIPYFPDRMCLFGKFWYDISKIPLSTDKIDFYKNAIRNFDPLPRRIKKNKRILFLTQPTTTRYFLDYIEKMLESHLFKDYELVVKLHPSEFKVWKDENPGLNGLEQKGYIRVIDSNSISLYDLLTSFDIAIAVASTAFFEALYFGCDAYLLNVPGVDWMEPLGNYKFLRRIRTPQELANYIDDYNQSQIDINEIFGDITLIK